MRNHILPLPIILPACALAFASSALQAQERRDWAQRPLEYQHSVTVELTATLSAPQGGSSILSHPVVRRLSSIPNVADLKIAGTLTGGTIMVTFGFRTVKAFNEWNEEPATREILEELENMSPGSVMLKLAMNPGAIPK